MKLAVQAAASVHLNGTLSGTGARTVGLDVSLTRSSGFSGTVTQSGIPLTIIDAGWQVYIRATRAFLAELAHQAVVAHRVGMVVRARHDHREARVPERGEHLVHP